jgi:hypothetical protein
MVKRPESTRDECIKKVLKRVLRRAGVLKRVFGEVEVEVVGVEMALSRSGAQ